MFDRVMNVDSWDMIMQLFKFNSFYQMDPFSTPWKGVETGSIGNKLG